MLLVPFIGVLTGIGFAALGVLFSAMATTFDDLSYVISGVITPLFLVAGTFFPLSRLPDWLRTLALLEPAVSLRRARPALRLRAAAGRRSRARRGAGGVPRARVGARGVAHAGAADRLGRLA